MSLMGQSLRSYSAFGLAVVRCRSKRRQHGVPRVIRVMGEGDDKILVEAVVDDVIEALSQVAA